MSAQHLGPYRIIRTLGEGGMGRVYEAVNESLGRRVAIKVLHAELANAPHITARFFNEARAVNLVQHPSIVSVSEFGQAEDGTPYMVMEYLEGESLAARLAANGRMPEGLPIIRQVASALAVAHRRGIIHRDIKPANIMLVPDPEATGGERAKVLDFGVAKLTDALTDGERMMQTQMGALMGTPAYMSPEQCRSATGATDRSDVYSLGIIAYQMLAGETPFSAEGLGDLLALHLYSRPPSLLDRAPGVPREIADLVHAMIAKSPGDRPSMAEVAEALGARAATPSMARLRSKVAEVSPSMGATEPGSAPAAASPESTPGPAPGATIRAPSRRPWRLLPPAAAATVLMLGIISLNRARRPEVIRRTAPVEAQRVHWHLDSTPPAAQVIRISDGEVLGMTPWNSEEDAASGPVEVVLRLAGYIDQRVSLEGDRDQSSGVVLQPLPAPPVPSELPAGAAPPPPASLRLVLPQKPRRSSAGDDARHSLRAERQPVVPRQAPPTGQPPAGQLQEAPPVGLGAAPAPSRAPAAPTTAPASSTAPAAAPAPRP